MNDSAVLFERKLESSKKVNGVLVSTNCIVLKKDCVAKFVFQY